MKSPGLSFRMRRAIYISEALHVPIMMYVCVCGLWCLVWCMLRVCTHFTDFCHTRMSIDIFTFECNIIDISNNNASQLTITSISNTFVFQCVLWCFFMLRS